MNWQVRSIAAVLMVAGVAEAQPAAAISSSATQPSVIVESVPPVVNRIMFDRFRKNPNMPTTLPGEAALTQSDYECAASVKYLITSQEHMGKHWHVTAKIGQIIVRTALTDTIYLPQMAPIELRAHEEGHRVMNERVYQEGQPIAHEAAEAVLQQEWSGDGKDVDEAGKAATDAAVKKFCDVYLAHTAHRASELGDIYDKLTNHGRNALVVANAIKLSFAEEKRIASTQPATTQISPQ